MEYISAENSELFHCYLLSGFPLQDRRVGNFILIKLSVEVIEESQTLTTPLLCQNCLLLKACTSPSCQVTKRPIKGDCSLFVISFPLRKAIKIASICFLWKRISKGRRVLYESSYLTALIEPNQPACKYNNNDNNNNNYCCCCCCYLKIYL